MATRSEPANHKQTKPERGVLGKSAATGRFVLKPASKGGSVSVAKVRAAAQSLSSDKK